MARKVFISVLGTSNYQECKYVTASYKSQPVRFVQEATFIFFTPYSQVFQISGQKPSVNALPLRTMGVANSSGFSKRVGSRLDSSI